MNLQLGIVLILLACLVIEAILARRSRNGIPERIVVTGTRGKSSLVRILVAGLRISEPDTWGKITGDAPLLLAPDGSRRPIRRVGPARLHEQRDILQACYRRCAAIIVMESMTISPETMKAEMNLVRPTLVAVTNVRDDHRETLGPDPYEQRDAYLRALPRGVPWLTLDSALLKQARRSRGIPEPETAAPPRDGLADEGIIRESLALGEAVLEALGRNSTEARLAMRAAAECLHRPLSGVTFLDQPMRLLDLFSANDTESLSLLWAEWRRNLQDKSAWQVLLATRADRPLRTRLFCDWLIDRPDVGMVHVTGNHDEAAIRHLRSRGIAAARLAPGALAPAGTASDDAGIIVGIGNAHGLAFSLRAEA